MGAGPLVDEWRGLWQGHPDRGWGLRWLETEARILELELAMLEEHGLTLPPETEPLRGLERNAQLGWRRRALAQTRQNCRGAWRYGGWGGGSPLGCGGGRLRWRRGDFGRASSQHHRRFFSAHLERVIRLALPDSVEIRLMTALPRPDTNWRCQAFSSVSRPRNLEGPSLDPGPDA